MRIVCPSCGEEPLKGQRHFCKPTETPRQQVELEFGNKGGGFGGGGTNFNASGTQRRIVNATPGAVCASIASLVSKNPALWRSGKALVRCGGEDFVAGLLATAVGLSGWHRDPKRALVCALAGRVADEAARALQDFWRCRLNARGPRQRVSGVSGGYQQLVVNRTPARGNTQRPPVVTGTNAPSGNAPQPSSHWQVVPVQGGSNCEGSRGRPPALTMAGAPPRNGSGVPPALPSPRQPETPRNKSNPRPAGTRAVPMNPIQALKQRRTQHQQESEERRMKDLQEAEEWRTARQNPSASSSPSRKALIEAVTGRPPSVGIFPTTPTSQENTFDAVGETGGGASGQAPEKLSNSCSGTDRAYARPSTPPTPRHQAHLSGEDEAQPTSLERRTTPITRLSPRGVPMPPTLPRRTDGESNSAPVTLDRWRAPETADSPRASSASAQCSSATERLRERVNQRKNNTSSDTRSVRQENEGAPDWKTRIEMRQREAETHQGMEEEHKQKVSERSCRRNDAMRRVMERQAQRQEDVVGLEA